MVGEPQLLFKVAAHSAEAGHLHPQLILPCGGQKHLRNPRLIDGRQRLLDARAQGAFPEFCQVQIHKFVGHGLVAFHIEAVAHALIVGLNGKAEIGAVSGHVRQGSNIPFRQHLVGDVEADLHIVQHGAVPVPNQKRRFHVVLPKLFMAYYTMFFLLRQAPGKHLQGT